MQFQIRTKKKHINTCKKTTADIDRNQIAKLSRLYCQSVLFTVANVGCVHF